MKSTIDKLAIFHMNKETDIIEVVHSYEEAYTINSIRLVKCEDCQDLKLLVKYVNLEEKLVEYCENLIIDCSIITSVVVNESTTFLLEYTLGGLRHD